MPLNCFLAKKISFALITLCALMTSASSLATANEAEREQLASLLRQLDLLTHSIEHYAVFPSSEDRPRYCFDYNRLRTDISRVRAGIEGYLTPERAQPRDDILLFGDYSRETPTPEITP